MKNILFLLFIISSVNISAQQVRSLAGYDVSTGLPGEKYLDTLRTLKLESPLYAKGEDTVAIDTTRFWNLSGNIGGPASVFGLTNNEDLRIITNNAQRGVVKGDGKIGLNVTDPVVNFQVNLRTAFGDNITALNATREFNIIGPSAGARILRISPGIDTAAPTIELMHRTTADGTNTSYWDMYTNAAGLNVRDRENSNVVPLTIEESTPTGQLYLKPNLTGINTGSNVAQQLHVADQAGASTRGFLISTHFTSAAGALFNAQKSRGTLASPSAVTTGDFLGVFDFKGYVGGTGLYAIGSRIASQVNGTVVNATTGLPTNLIFSTSNGTTGLAEKWRISAGGALSNTGADGTTALQTTAFATAYRAITTTATIASTDHTLEATSGTFTATLPTAVGITGREYWITNTGSGTITLATTSSQTFVNVTATPTTLSIPQFTSYKVTSNGANWMAFKIVN